MLLSATEHIVFRKLWLTEHASENNLDFHVILCEYGAEEGKNWKCEVIILISCTCKDKNFSLVPVGMVLHYKIAFCGILA